MSMKVREALEKTSKVIQSRDDVLSLVKPLEYKDGRTKQAFKDQCDINKILKKAQVTGSLAFAQKYDQLQFGEFDGEFDLLTAHERIAKANNIFGELPSEVRREFDNDPFAFFAFANEPENQGRLVELLPKLAEPGSQFPNPVKRGGQGAGAATAPLQTTNEVSAPEGASSEAASPQKPPESGGAANTST